MFEFRERRNTKDTRDGGMGFLSESPISKHKRGGAEFFLNRNATKHTETNNKSIKEQFQSPRLISPEQDMISYLRKQNENLKLENKRKDNLIGKLLENASYRGSRTKFHPPRTVEPLPQTRLPTIATPLQRFDTLERQNEQNWSFGKDSTKNIRPIKNNLTKPLFKLPQEFHIQAWVKK